MAKGHGVNPGYKPGHNWDTCDRCGFERRATDLTEEWNGLTVCKDTCFEPRHPMDFLRVTEEQIVPDLVGTKEGYDTSSDSTAAAAMAANRTGPDHTIPSGDNDNDL